MNGKHTLRTKHRCHAFSLIELLAAIAVIGILSVLLITAMQGVRLYGQITRNLSNLRNLQLANIAYAADNNGSYVADCSFDENGGLGNTWISNRNFLCKYLGLPSNLQWPKEMRSPMAVMLQEEGSLPLNNSYGYNFTGLAAYGTHNASRQATVTNVSQPAATLAFADALDWQIQMNGAHRYQGREEGQNNAIAYRYNGKAGVVYFDGHAEMLHRGQVINNEKLWVIDKD